MLFEWGHRAIAGTVSILTLTLALWVWIAERRAWVRYTALAAVALYALSGARARTPDLRRFMDGEGPAWYSPPLLAAVRRRRHQGTLAEGAART